MLDVDLVDGANGTDAGVVDEDVHLPGLRDDRINQIVAALGRGDVQRQGQRPRTQLRGAAGRSIHINVGDDYGRAGRVQGSGDGQADAARRAADDGGFASQFLHFMLQSFALWPVRAILPACGRNVAALCPIYVRFMAAGSCRRPLFC